MSNKFALIITIQSFRCNQWKHKWFDKVTKIGKSRFAERSRNGSTHGWQTLMPIRGCFRCHHHHEHHQEFYHHNCYHHHSHCHDNRPPSILQAQLVTFWWQTVGPRTVRLGAQFAKNITIIPGNDHYYLNHHNSSYRQSPNNAGEPEVQTVSPVSYTHLRAHET